MADNVGYTPGTGATVAADDIAGILHQRVKLSLGADGTAVDAPGNDTDGLLVKLTNSSIPIGDGTTVVTIDTDPADGEANSGNALHVEGRTYVYNGTTWDRVRGDISNGMDVDVTRVGGVVAIGDGSNAVSVDTTGTDAESNAVNTLHTQARLYDFNGTTWDRKRGQATISRVATYTSAQTGVAVWTPGSGRAACVTALQIQSYGTTAGTCIVWFGASADTTYTRGTDIALFDGEFAPSSTNKPGVFVALPFPMRGTADHIVRVTTTNAQSVTVSLMGFEI
jgi:hypothetical protein